MKIAKKSHASFFSFLWVCSILILPAGVPESGQLKVIVTDLEKMPLKGIQIEICSSALDRIQEGHTNAEGVCVFGNLPAGTYQVKFGSGIKKIAPRKIAVSTETAVLRMSMERPVEVFINGRPGPELVDPAITSFTPSDAKILNEVSSSLKESIAATWGQISSAADVCERREILIEARKKWLDMLGLTQRKLRSPPQAQEKRSMIYRVFNEMTEHLRYDSGSISEFGQNAAKLKHVLDTIAKVLKRAAESGAATFDLQVVSQPPDAIVSYDDGRAAWTEHPEHTPTTIRGLNFVRCQISIKHEGYDEIDWFYDPYLSLKEGYHQLRATMQPLSQVEYVRARPAMEKRVHESDLIIVGEAQQARARREKIGSDVYTYTTVVVKEWVKGSGVRKGDKIVIRVLGGAIPEEGIFQYGEAFRPYFEMGELAVLMLKRIPESNDYQVVAGRQGKFPIQGDEVTEGAFGPVKDFIRKIKEIMKSE